MLDISKPVGLNRKRGGVHASRVRKNGRNPHGLQREELLSAGPVTWQLEEQKSLFLGIAVEGKCTYKVGTAG